MFNIFFATSFTSSTINNERTTYSKFFKFKNAKFERIAHRFGLGFLKDSIFKLL